MSFNLTTPETQDIKTLKTLYDLVDTFGEAATDSIIDAGFKATPEMEAKGQDLENVAMAADNEDTETLATLRIMDFALKAAFEAVATTEGAQEKILTFVPQDLGSEVNANLIEKYELTGLAILVQRVKKGPNP